MGDSFGDLVGGEVSLVVGDAVGVDHHADLASGLDGEGFDDSGLSSRDVFEVVEALDVAFHRFAAGAWACGGDGVGGHDDWGVESCCGDVGVVTADGVEDGFVFLAVLGGEVHPDLGVSAFHFVVHGFPDVVEESGASCETAVESELVGDDLGEVGDFDGVLEDILAVGGAVGELAHRFDDLGVEAFKFEFLGGVFPGFDDFLVDLGLDLVGHFFDSARVHSSIGNEAFEGFDGDGLADLVEAGDDDHAWGVVDDDVGAGGFFEGSDVASFASDDSSFEVVGRDGDCADGGFGGVLVGVSLDRVDQDLAGFVFGFVFGFVDDFAGDLAHFASGFVGDAFEEHFFGLRGVELGDAGELAFLFIEQIIELGLL